MSVALARNVAGSRSTCDDGVSDVRTGQTNASATAMKLCRYWAVSRSGTDQDVVRAKLPELQSVDWDFGDSQVDWPCCPRLGTFHVSE